MKADDPRLEQARQEMNERIKKYDERMLTVSKEPPRLRGLPKPARHRRRGGGGRGTDHYSRASFDVAKEIDPPEIEPPVWDLLGRRQQTPQRRRPRPRGEQDRCKDG